MFAFFLSAVPIFLAFSSWGGWLAWIQPPFSYTWTKWLSFATLESWLWNICKQMWDFQAFLSKLFKAKRRGGWGLGVIQDVFLQFFYVVLEIAQKWLSLFREQKIFFFGLDSSFLRRRRRRTLGRHQCFLNPPKFPPLFASCQWGFSAHAFASDGGAPL